VGFRASAGYLKALAEVLAVLGGAAEAALGAGGILAALSALAHSRALDSSTVGLSTTSTTSLGASGGHFIQRRRKNTQTPPWRLSSLGGIMDDGIDAIVNYVLSPTKVNITDFVWKKCCDQVIEGRQVGFVVYRGQSVKPRFRTTQDKSDATAIQTNLGRPLSTSTKLNMHVVSYSRPDGRVFKIHVTPGIEYVDVVGDLRKADAEGKLDNDYFQRVLETLPAEGAYRKGKVDKETGAVIRQPITTGEQLKEAFWKLVAKENEVILNPRGLCFRSETTEKETWNRQGWEEEDARETIRIEDPPGIFNDIEVYETGAFLCPTEKKVKKKKKEKKKTLRRGRTFRRSSKRRNKNGSRSARKSKRRFGHGHA
jgi:hypothetical protein